MKDKNQVFVVSLAITIIMAIWAVAFNANFTVVSNAAYSFLTNNFGWLYLMAMTAFVIFSVAIAFSKWGKIKLGPDDSKPEYSTVSWFAMLFGAGMGVGLVFWGISEPLAHFSSPIPGIELARKPPQILPYGPATCTGDFIRGQTIASLDWALPISSSARENRVLSVPYLNP